MHSASKSGNRVDVDPYNISQSTLCPEPWWHNTAYNPAPPAVMHRNVSETSSLENSDEGIPQSDGGQNEDDRNTTKDSQSNAPMHSGLDGNISQENLSQHVTSNSTSLTQPPQHELVAHSIACSSNAYYDPYYYDGMMAAYGQPLVHPQLVDMHQTRMPLHLDMAQEPVYVNAKQYHGILRRRQSRAKAELERKLIKERKPYLHESRHQHAIRRARASGGRFAKKSDVDASKQQPNQAKDDGGNSVPAASAQSYSSSGSEPMPSDSNTNYYQEARGLEINPHTYAHDGGMYRNQEASKGLLYDSHSTERGEGATSKVQQWGNIRSDQAQQRATAMR